MRMGNIWLVVFICLFYLVGFGLLGYGLWCARIYMRAAAWPTSPATITSLDLQENIGKDSCTYEVKVRYTYTVDGVAYEGDRLAFGYAGSSGCETHNKIFLRIKEAKAVSVRYSPDDPSVSCLSFGVHRSIQFMLVFAVTWLLFVIGFSILFWLSSRSDMVLFDNLSVR